MGNVPVAIDLDVADVTVVASVDVRVLNDCGRGSGWPAADAGSAVVPVLATRGVVIGGSGGVKDDEDGVVEKKILFGGGCLDCGPSRCRA